MPYTEPVAPLGPVYPQPVPRADSQIATDASWGAFAPGLAGVEAALASGQQQIGPVDSNLAGLAAQLATANEAWANSPVVEALSQDAEALSQPNPVGGPTIPLSLSVPQMPSGPSPLSGLGTWLRNNVHAYLVQLQAYLNNIGMAPVYIPPTG